MKTATLQTVMTASYATAAELLAEALDDLKGAADAARAGQLTLAYGTALPSAQTVARVHHLLAAVDALSALPRS